MAKMNKAQLLSKAEDVAKAAGLEESPVTEDNTNAEIEEFIDSFSVEDIKLVIGKVALTASGSILAPGTQVTDQLSPELIEKLVKSGAIVESV